AVATIIAATIPIFTVLLAVLRLRQPVRLHHLVGLGVALAGIALATAGTDRGAGGFSTDAAIGDACLLISALCIAAYYVLSTEMAVRHGVVTVSAWTTIFGALLLAPLAVWSIGAGAVRWTPLGIGVVAYLSLLVTVLGTWIWLHALRALPARIAASSQYVQPLIGVAASAAIFQTSLDAGFAVGSVLVLAGIALCSVAGRSRG
ncbi:MAG: DMT family transporter, partial [Acetobacteraceae bacterium]